jgi:penicillin-binding protein 1C
VTAASALVVDNATGEILAYVGSPRFDDEANGGWNDGVRAERQPGSTLKPFLYAVAMEDLGWTPATLLPDVELHVPTPNGTYAPRNYDERFHGPVRLREALGSSLNVPAVNTVTEIGVGRALDRLREMGLSSLGQDASYYGPALALGDGEVRLYELAAAYSALARGGVYKPLRAVRGDFAWAPDRRVMTERAAAMVTSVLSDPTARVGSFGEHTVLDLPFPVAAKTGTSKGYRDNWTIGFTREVTVAVWVGNFDGSPMKEVSGITGAGPLFRAAMAAAMRRAEAPAEGAEGAAAEADVADPASLARAGLERVCVCALSGGAPGPGCSHTVHEWVPKGTRLEACKMHETVRVDTRNGLLATPSCPRAFVAERSFEVFEGPFAAWAHAAGRGGAPVETSPLCPGGGARTARARAAGDLAIRYPHDGARFVIDPDRPRAAQAIPLEVDAAHGATVALYVDGRKAGTSASGSPVYWALAAGDHAIVAESAGRRSDPVTISVE